MKKRKFVLLSLFMTAMFSACGLLSACESGASKISQVAFSLPYYDGTYKTELDAEDKPQFNQELWRRSDLSLSGADPMVLNDIQNTGYYYAYVTGFNYYYSKDLENWSYGGGFVSLPSKFSGAECYWAPEVTYDKQSQKYYAFFSLTPPADTNYEAVAAPLYMPMVAVSDSPKGPFVPIDFSDAASSGQSIRNIDSKSYPQWYAKYALFDSAEYQAAFKKTNLTINKSYPIYSLSGGYIDKGWVTAIDLHPFTDPDTGDRYLYWSQTPGSIAGVKMTNWLTPDWSTYQVLTACRYYSIADYIDAQNGKSVQNVYNEEAAAYCNEGPFLYKHDGKFYLTFSIGAYNESSYGVMQAVADSPLGAFRKLTDSENGMLLNNDMGDNDVIAGPGHHSFVQANVNGENKMYIAYHAHDNVKKYTNRHVQFDEVKWVKVKDINGNDLDVMHINGPTANVQPGFGVGKEYGDVSSSIKEIKFIRGKLENGSSADSLIDGLIPFYIRINKEFESKYVKETVVKSDSTFEITLDKAREIRGIMFYNSKNTETAFQSIKNIAFICEENGSEKIYIIERLSMDKGASYVYNDTNSVYKIIRGANCYAEFRGINVKSIRFTVELPDGQDKAGISEVALVGKLNK